MKLQHIDRVAINVSDLYIVRLAGIET